METKDLVQSSVNVDTKKLLFSKEENLKAKKLPMNFEPWYLQWTLAVSGFYRALMNFPKYDKFQELSNSKDSAFSALRESLKTLKDARITSGTEPLPEEPITPGKFKKQYKLPSMSLLVCSPNSYIQEKLAVYI